MNTEIQKYDKQQLALVEKLEDVTTVRYGKKAGEDAAITTYKPFLLTSNDLDKQAVELWRHDKDKLLTVVMDYKRELREIRLNDVDDTDFLVSHYEGVSPAYKERVENYTEYSNWAQFWCKLHADSSDIPTFYFNVKDMRRYAFTVCENHIKAFSYLNYCLSEFMKCQHLYSQETIDFVKSELIKDIEEIKRLIENYKILKGVQEDERVDS